MKRTLPAPLDVKLMNVTATVLFLGCAALLLAAASWWVVRHPAFSISRIIVEGELVHNNAVTLRANVAPSLMGNFFTIDLGAARETFEEVPWVREAQVRREYPNSLRVELHEHVAEAFWGPDTGAEMVNSFGEVFEANIGEVEREGIPRLQGPSGSSQQVLQVYRMLAPALAPLSLEIDELTLNERGSWKARLAQGAQVELGGGTVEQMLQRVQRFTRTLATVTTQYQRKADALEYVDLRYEDGYALRLHGVSTVQGKLPPPRPKPQPKPAAARR